MASFEQQSRIGEGDVVGGRVKAWLPVLILMLPVLLADVAWRLIGNSFIHPWIVIGLATFTSMAAWMAVGRITWVRSLLDGVVLVCFFATHVAMAEKELNADLEKLVLIFFLLVVSLFSFGAVLLILRSDLGFTRHVERRDECLGIVDLFLLIAVIGIVLGVFQRHGYLQYSRPNPNGNDFLAFACCSLIALPTLGSMFSILIGVPTISVAKFVVGIRERSTRWILVFFVATVIVVAVWGLSFKGQVDSRSISDAVAIVGSVVLYLGTKFLTFMVLFSWCAEPRPVGRVESRTGAVDK